MHTFIKAIGTVLIYTSILIGMASLALLADASGIFAERQCTIAGFNCK